MMRGVFPFVEQSPQRWDALIGNGFSRYEISDACQTT
jgi:hypothetical protein